MQYIKWKILFDKSLLYHNYSERYISCAHEDQMIKLDLIDKHSYNQISDKDLEQAYLELVIIGVKR